MKQLFTLVFTLAFYATTSFSQISGTVFRDYNNNGTRETSSPNEPLANGIIVNAYNANDILVGTATTSGTTSPNYSIAIAAGNYRLEFIVPGSFVNTGSGKSGSASGTSVRFVTAPATNQSFGIFNRNEYYQDNPTVIVPRYYRGTAAPLSNTNAALNSFPYNYGQEKDGTTLSSSGVWTDTWAPPAGYRPDPAIEATQLQIGTTYGMAWNANTRTVYMGAYLRRKAPLGPNGLGAIYKMNGASGNATTNNPTLYVDLNSIFANAPGGILGFTRETNGAYNWNSDVAVKPLIGKRGLGDIEINNNKDTLYTIGLNDRKLYAVPTSGALNNTTIKSYDFISGITSLTGVAVGQFANSEIHPFGIGINPRDNYVYIGGTYGDDGNNGVSTNIRMLVWRLDPATGIITLVLNQFLGYGRSDNMGINYGAAPVAIPTTAPAGNSKYFEAWNDNFNDATNSNISSLPQAMLTGIAFDGDVMILGFRDRFGDQTPVAGVANPSDAPYSRGNGEIIRVHSNAGTWTVEAAGVSKDGNTGANITGSTVANTGPGSGEFYHQEWASDGDAFEACMGALIMIPGKGSVMATAFDPSKVNQNNLLVFGNANTNGVQVHNNVDGKNVGAYEVATSSQSSVANCMGKTNGIGDIEALIDAPYIEIGNRVWNDANGNGVQDAGEATFNGVTVQLYSNGADGIPGNADDVLLGTTTTSASGEWYFNNTNVTDGDPTTAGNQAGPQPNYNYNVRTALPANTQLTKKDKQGSGAADVSDNDAAMSPLGVPMISLTTGNAGENNHNFDFGFKTLNKLGDKVWLDDNKNGVQDAGEPGVAGITVTLYSNGADNNPGTADDFVIGNTVTDAYGNYFFDNLPNGNYNVSFTLPANYQFTTSAGTDDVNATNSDANAVTGRTTTISLTGGENELDVDAGIIFSQPQTASLGDRVWFDVNSNGSQDGTEPGMAGVTVTLYDASGNVVATTVTDANGNYIFNNLSTAVQYRVGITLPAGMTFSTKDAGGNDNTDSDINTSGVNFGKTDLLPLLTAGENRTNVDAGLVTTAVNTASIGDLVWNDLNQNGIQDAGEPGVAGVTVTLYAADGITVIATTVTDVFGNYIFTNLPGNTSYVIGIALPSGYAVSLQDVGNDTKDNDINSGTLKTGQVNLPNGIRNLSLDAGIYQTAPAGTARLGDRVWYDNGIGGGTASDGIQNGTESGVAGVTVTLYNNAGTAIATTSTDANGNYSFVNLAAGTYSVGFSNLPAGYSFTTQGQGTAATGSDANAATGRTASVTLSAGQNNPDIDAGIIAGVASGLGSLGNKVWYDLNNNGLQDAGELGVAGVTVTLLDAGLDGIVGNGDDGASKTTVTNSLGEYLFDGLNAGNYVVQFSNLPTSFIASPQNAGTNDDIDSDGGALGTGGAPAGASRTAVINLTSGQDNLTVDLGINRANTNSIGNFVWYDLNSNGIQDAGEPGVAGVAVILLDGFGIPVDGNTVLAGIQPVTTTTNANGQYLFAGLADGTYSVAFTNLPAGFDYTVKDNDGTPGNGTTESDGDLVNGITPTVTVNAGNRNDNSLDMGLISTRAALGNFVWLDRNGNGTQDGGESGVPGVTVSLYYDANNDGDFADAGENLPAASMITDQNGQYFFPNLLPGNYQVAFTTVPSGLSFTVQNTPGDNGNNTNSDAVPTTGRTGTIVLSAGEVDLTIDAGLYSPIANVGNYVWADNNGNNIQDAGEQGVAGVVATLYTSAGVPVSTTVTDKNGFYMFTNVPPGNYYIGFSNTPGGASFVTGDAGGDDNTDSDVNGANGMGTTTTFNVPYASVNISLDAGLVYIQTLPITLKSFTAIASGNNAVLNWEVESQVNFDHFEIERSVTSNGGFETIGQKVLSSNSQYVYNDINAASKGQAVYYRLKMVDTDGKYSYSNVAVVRFGKGTTIDVRPTILSRGQAITVNLAGNDRKAYTIQITDMNGRLLVQRKAVAGNTAQISSTGLVAGVYLIRVFNNDEEKITKIVVQ